MAAEHTFTRPIRQLLLRLPLLPTTLDHRIDYEAADSALLLQLADDAATVVNTINQGLSALGVILAHSACEIGSEIGSDTIEAIGWYIAESSDASATLLNLIAACRHHTADYSPPEPQQAPLASF